MKIGEAPQFGFTVSAPMTSRVPRVCVHVWDSLPVPGYIHSQTSWRLSGSPKVLEVALNWDLWLRARQHRLGW
jgi:hypothetical protein